MTAPTAGGRSRTTVVLLAVLALADCTAETGPGRPEPVAQAPRVEASTEATAPAVRAPAEDAARDVAAPAPCTVRAPGTERTLSREAARAVTTVVALAQRHGLPDAMVAAALDRALLPGAASTPVDPALVLATPPAATRPSAESTALVEALSGRNPAALSCEVTHTNPPDEPLGPSGLVPQAQAQAQRERMLEVFGDLPMGGFAAGGVDSGHVEDSSHYDGRAIDVFFRPVDAGSTARGWVLAHWLVAHGEGSSLLSVIFDDRIWTSWASCAGWRTYVHPSGDTTNPVLRHLDHVHTAVQGTPRERKPEEEAERAVRGPVCPR